MLALLLAAAPRFAVSVSPAHLSLPVIEVQLETYVSESVGVAAIAGAGVVRGAEARYGVLSLGLQGRLYGLGDVRAGAYLAGEVIGTRVDDRASPGALLTSGLAINALVGYKGGVEGFIFDLGLGLAWRAQASEARDHDRRLRRRAARWAPALNLNLGWAF